MRCAWGVGPGDGGRAAWSTPDGFVLVGRDAVDALGTPGLRPALAAALARQLHAAHRSPRLSMPDPAAAELEADCFAGLLLGLSGGRDVDVRALIADPPRAGADLSALPAPLRARHAAAGLALGAERRAGGSRPLPPRAALRACGELEQG